MRTVAIANQKGGCGKTTTAVNLAAAFAERHYKTLLIDLDPQGHSTIAFDYDPDEFSTTMYDGLANAKTGIESVTIGTGIELLDLAPSNILLSGAELDLAGVVGREFVLSERLKQVQAKYDVCLIDCPPSLGLLTLNGLLASTGVVVPVQVHYFATEGLKQIFETADIIEKRFPPCRLTVLGVLLTFAENGTLLSRQVQQQMRDVLGHLVFETVISRGVKLAEAPSIGEPILHYAPKSRAAAEYRELAEEITKNWALLDEIKALAAEINGDEGPVER
ncbi:MAG: ParA family protein [Planctomycetota bacterium]|jgi:chromosome partitioning protein